MLQDQEVLEAKRARDEKDDRLREALAVASALKADLEYLQRSRFLVYPTSKLS